MADRDRILVVGGGHAEIPLIDAAHELGFEVFTTGNRPHDLGHRRADGYVGRDFSDPEAIRDLAAELGVVGIVSGCNDFAAISTASAAEQLGLPGHDSHETYLRIHHKDRFRALLEELGLPTPRSVVVRDAAHVVEQCEPLGYPVIVKPVDLTGGKGMTVCRSPHELAPAIDHAFTLTRQDYVVVEQFMEGTRHGYTCFVAGHRVGFWFADDEQYYRNEFLVSGTTTPTSMPAPALDELRASVERISEHLGLVDGLMHVQCILTANGPRIVELCRRCPGDLYPWFVQLSTGYPYARAVVQSELGLPFDTAPADGRPVARHCLMATSEGVLRSIEMDDTVTARLIEQMTWWQAGDRITNHLVDKFGIVFLGFDGVDDMTSLAPTLSDRIAITITADDAVSAPTAPAVTP